MDNEKSGKTIEETSGKVRELFEEAKQKLKEGDYEGAIEKCDEAVEIKPNTADPYANRGLIKMNLKHYSEALVDYNRAIEINPNVIEAYNNRGVIKITMEHYEEAIADFDTEIGINPNFVKAYNNRGIAKMKLKRYENAIADFNKAIKMDPNYMGAYYNLGNAKAELGYYDEALVDYNRVLRINPADNDAKKQKLFLSYKKGYLIPKYLYIPFFTKDIYWYRWYIWWSGMCFLMSLFLSLFYFQEDTTILDIVHIDSLYVLIGFFFFELVLHQKKRRGAKDDTFSTFKILIKSFLVGISFFILAYILGIYIDGYAIALIENTLGLLFITLLYVLINRMCTLFLKISEYKEDIAVIASVSLIEKEGLK